MRFSHIFLGLFSIAALPAYAASSPSHQAPQAAKQVSTLALGKVKECIWKDAPQWLSRTELDIGWGDEEAMRYSILTTQPIWQSADKTQTFLMQASAQRYDLYSITRDAANFGLGYRQLLLDNSLLLGINTFGDHEFHYGHSRWSIGGEVKYGAVDFNANRYMGIGSKETVKGSDERAMSGYDAELGTTLPYLPWAHVYGKYFVWEKEVGSSNTIGNDFSAEFDLLPNISLVAGTQNDNLNTRENYAMLRFRLGADGKPTLATKPVSAVMWSSRDLRDETLKKVRRENRIITERATTSGGVTVIVKKG